MILKTNQQMMKNMLGYPECKEIKTDCLMLLLNCYISDMHFRDIDSQAK